MGRTNPKRYPKQILVPVTPEQREVIEQAAARYGTSMATVMRWALNSFFGWKPDESKLDEREPNKADLIEYAS